MSIHVEEQIVDVTLPTDKLGIVMMQPFIQLNVNSHPYKWAVNKKQTQLDAINKTLQLSQAKHHGCQKTHFTIFPEYSIPGIEGINLINEFARDTQESGTFIMAGIEGLTKEEYETLCNMPNTEVYDANKPANLGQNKWINCLVLWAKLDNGQIIMYIQPKCFKSLPENHLPSTNMFEGKCIYLYRCRRGTLPFLFLSMVCIDWIGTVSGKEMFSHILDQIEPTFPQNPIELDLLFIIQNNDKPNNDKFLENARNFFENTNLNQGVNRDNAILIFANTAGGDMPGIYDLYGGSSFICSRKNPYYPGKCEKSYATSTEKLRGNKILSRCKDFFLRESGACIYSINIAVPKSLSGIVDIRDQHIKAKIHPLNDTHLDRRLPNDEVPASIKWLLDSLEDECDGSCNSVCNIPIFSADIDRNHQEILSKLKTIAHERILEIIEYAIYDMLLYNKLGFPSLQKSSRFKNRIALDGIYHHMIDHWSDEEAGVLKEIVYLLSILMLCFEIKLEESVFHCSIDCRKQVFHILYVEHVSDIEKLQELPLSDGKSFVVVLIKTDHPLRSIMDVQDSGLSKITDVRNNSKFINVAEVYTNYGQSSDIRTLRKKLLKLIL